MLANDTLSLDFQNLRSLYGNGVLTPAQVVKEIFNRLDMRANDPAWIYFLPRENILAQAKKLEDQNQQTLPLYGLPFAVKDNIDIEGYPTSAGCPAYAYTARSTATVIRKLQDAGAILIGKTNLDQFATGLVGARSPYGSCHNSFNEKYISGGSSSGSALVVANGLVSFSLGTDTAGSGRVPAGFNNIVGLKPTRGLLSTYGVVPACRSLDCISIFALTCEDAQQILSATEGYDTADIYSRKKQSTVNLFSTEPFRFGIPDDSHLNFCGDQNNKALFEKAISQVESLGGIPVKIDFSAFREAANLLYEGPWVAERVAAIKSFYESHPDEMHPVIKTIFDHSAKFSAVDTFSALYRLESLKRHTAEQWKKMDVLIVPTAPTIYTIAEVKAEPIKLNNNLGYYTNFVNLLDLAAIAVPAGLRSDGLPGGITLIGPAWSDNYLAAFAAEYHRISSTTMGATKKNLPPVRKEIWSSNKSEMVKVAVVGAHLSGQPLNHQLTERGAKLLRTCQTAPHYQLYALQKTTPQKPGLIRAVNGSGKSIEVEVWQIPVESFGSFVSGISSPLGIGTVELDNGEQVKGFLCEPWAISDAKDISDLGGWRNYLKQIV